MTKTAAQIFIDAVEYNIPAEQQVAYLKETLRVMVQREPNGEAAEYLRRMSLYVGQGAR